MRGCAAATLAVALLALATAVSAADPAFYHFSVIADDQTTVQVIFPNVPGVPAAAYVVQRAANSSFDTADTVASNPIDTGAGSWLVMDSTAAWAPSPTPAWYRVLIMGGPTGPIMAQSPPLQPLNQTGNRFVVSVTGVSSPANCGNLFTPCYDIKAAVALAANDSFVYVTPGIYTGPENRDISFGGKAITVQSTNGRDLTQINCTSQGRAFIFQNGEGPTSVLSGLTVTDGAAPQGGCVLIMGASPTIENMHFAICTALTLPASGGAIYVEATAPGPVIRDSMFTYNQADDGGAAYFLDAMGTVINSHFNLSVCTSPNAAGGTIYFKRSMVNIYDTNITNGYAGYSAGGIGTEMSVVNMFRTSITKNTGSMSGGLMVFASNVTAVDCDISNNRAELWGGGFLALYGIYNATGTTHNNNYGKIGGGGIALVSSVGLITGGTINGNSAVSGGGIEVQKQSGVSPVPSILVLTNVVLDGNTATDKGAGINILASDTVVFVNATFSNNVAVSGAGGWCQDSSIDMYASKFENNTAHIGGAFYMTSPCKINAIGSIFNTNSALQFGAGLAVGDDTDLTVSSSMFIGNGFSTCVYNSPPLGGGAIIVGFDKFSTASQCGAAVASPARVSISTSMFEGNQAFDRGGAVLVEAGNVTFKEVAMIGNSASGERGREGVGGALALSERCIDGVCTLITATLSSVNISGNTAAMAGGGILYRGANPNSTISLWDSLVAANAIVGQGPLGAGGGIYIGRSNFDLYNSTFFGNIAYYGGAAFISADFSGSSLSLINMINNDAVLGSAAYWLRRSSPQTPLTCTSCFIQPPAWLDMTTAVATEVLEIAYTATPPASVQSSKEVGSFGVSLLDFYGHVGITADTGSCVIEALASANPNGAVIIQADGSEEAISSGVAGFAHLRVTGTIGSVCNLTVTCSPTSGGRSPLLLPASGSVSLAPISLPMTISSCPAGTEPNRNGDGCVDCSYGFYNFDGKHCLACPEGAVCPGGQELLAENNYWRSDNTSVDFVACRDPGSCQAGPFFGDAACTPGHHGPLCAVCDDDYFKFSGKCMACRANAQAKAMLALTVTLFAVMLVLIFARSWEFGGTGPGILTKIKIFTAHLQMLALFRDYDVAWPRSTHDAMGWFEMFNVGLSITAPECFIGNSYTFYYYYIFEMALPFIAVALCVAVYFGASALQRHKDPERTERLGSRGLPVWLEGLKLRCWKNSFWLVTLLYPRCAMTALQLFSTMKLDTGTYLVSDFSILVRPLGGSYVGTYVKYLVPGTILLVIFAAIIPLFWFFILWVNRRRLDDPVVAAKFGFLYSAYSRRLPFWETTEMVRKFLIALIPVFVKAQSEGSLQGSIGQIVILAYLFFTTWLRPFAKAEDNGLQIASLIVLWLLLLSGGIAKWASLSPLGERALGGAQLALSSAVAFVLVGAVAVNGVSMLRRVRKSVNNRLSIWKDTDAAGKAPGGGLTIKVNAGGAPAAEEGEPSGADAAPESPPAFGDGNDSMRRPMLPGLAEIPEVEEDEEGAAAAGPSGEAAPPVGPRVAQWISGSEKSFDRRDLDAELGRRGGK